MLQQTEWNQLNASAPVSQRVKSYASSPFLFKRNLLLAEDTKHIQEKEHRMQNTEGFFMVGGILSSPVDLYLS